MKINHLAVRALFLSSFLLSPSISLGADIVAKVLSVEGEAFAQDKPLKVGMRMGPGVTISTKACSKVKLFLYPRAVAYLGPDSRMKLGKPEQANKVLAGMFRFIYSKAEEFKKTGSEIYR